MARVTRKELLNGPDEFVTTTGSALVWLREHPAQFILGAVVVISILTGGYGLYYWKTSRDSSGMNAYLKAADNPQMTIKVSQDFSGTKAGKLAKLRLARMSYGQGDYPKALSYAEDFINGWSRKDTFHWQAALIIASTHINQKEPLKALPLLDACIDSASQDLKDQALLLKASILISQGKEPDAKQVLSAVSENYKEIAKTMLASQAIHPETKAGIQQ
ncbi:MAG TPA: tetratricopeptide repeat protein [Desulfomonilia bacterium]|jgi:predicted negative regulator of RcsB-dependent stress response|nr:tetratricopeptide repeat protein [Thermodesulfobacteriota bacterium]HWR69161.1 tetratricopeptide repeat protein [Desulfomonilia bacterium]